MDVKELLFNTLEKFEYPVYLQGSMSQDEEYPESFFTYFNNSTTDDAFYNNAETQVIWDFDVNFYSADPDKVISTLNNAKKKLKAAGFIADGSGHDVLSDEITHTGRGINLFYIEKVRINA